MAGSPDAKPNRRCAVIVDTDNFFVGGLDPSEVTHVLNRIVTLALSISAEYEEINIRFYGGWLHEGVLTRRGSELQGALASDFFPRPHPYLEGLLRGSAVLVTRLVAVPGLEWQHLYRTKRGLPRLRLADGRRPSGCVAADNCPIDQFQRISRRRARACHVHGCPVTNEEAFLLEEQKMVDSLMCCDTIALAASGGDLIVLSDDLDVLPAVAQVTAFGDPHVVVIRSAEDVGDLYGEALSRIGVHAGVWEAA